jgi:hypothetical protein
MLLASQLRHRDRQLAVDHPHEAAAHDHLRLERQRPRLGLAARWPRHARRPQLPAEPATDVAADPQRPAVLIRPRELAHEPDLVVRLVELARQIRVAGLPALRRAVRLPGAIVRRLQLEAQLVEARRPRQRCGQQRLAPTRSLALHLRHRVRPQLHRLTWTGHPIELDPSGPQRRVDHLERHLALERTPADDDPSQHERRHDPTATCT